MSVTPLEDRQAGCATVSVVLPVFNEVRVLETLVDRLDKALKGEGYRYEIVFVNDGSTDGSAEALDALAGRSDMVVRVLHFTRNFGQPAAVQAGLMHTSGDAVVVMDSDLQDEPESIPALLAPWREGCDVVYAIRASRQESLPKRALFLAFYRLLNAVADVAIPQDAGNFGLMDRGVAELVRMLPDRDRFFPGLRSWVGFRQRGIPLPRGRRYDDVPRVSLRGLVRLAKSAIFSFSVVPLGMFYVIAGLSVMAAVGAGCFALYHKWFTGLAIPGWTSNTVSACFYGALNALGIAVVGEYLARIFEQVKNRPLFLVGRVTNPHERSAGAPLLTGASERAPTARSLPANATEVSHPHPTSLPQTRGLRRRRRGRKI